MIPFFRLSVFTLLILPLFSVYAQSPTRPDKRKYIEADTNVIYTIAAQMPVPPKPYKIYCSDINNACIHLKEPMAEKRQYFEYVVEKDGRLSSIKKVHRVSELTRYDSCIINQLKSTEAWQPGLEKSVTVRVRAVSAF